MNNEYWCIAKEDSEDVNDRIVIYDEVKRSWRLRTGIVSAEIASKRARGEITELR